MHFSALAPPSYARHTRAHPSGPRSGYTFDTNVCAGMFKLVTSYSEYANPCGYARYVTASAPVFLQKSWTHM